MLILILHYILDIDLEIGNAILFVFPIFILAIIYDGRVLEVESGYCNYKGFCGF